MLWLGYLIYENFKMFSLYMCLTYMYIPLLKYRTFTMLVFIPELSLHFWVHCWCQYSTFLNTVPSLYLKLSPLQEAGWELGPGLWLLPVWDPPSGPDNHQRRSVWDPCLCPGGPVWICEQNVTNVLWKPKAHQFLVLWVILLLSIHVNVLHVFYLQSLWTSRELSL